MARTRRTSAPASESPAVRARGCRAISSGVDITGKGALANYIGVEVAGGTGAIIGIVGTTTSDVAQRNILSGNVKAGVQIKNSTGNRISGNFVGLDIDGVSALPNTDNGIHLAHGSTHNIVGFDKEAGHLGWALQRNIVSGNGKVGILLEAVTDSIGTSRENRVSGNYVGTDTSGTARMPNGVGIWIGWNSTDHLIGTDADGVSDEAERNLISGNKDNEIIVGIGKLSDSSGSQIAGNYIGTDVTGTQALGSVGVKLQSSSHNTRIGTHGDGTPYDANRRNVISGNKDHGITFGNNAGRTISGVQIKGNLIGVDKDGVLPLGNQTGISLAGNGAAPGPDTVLIGGETDVEKNIIASNRTSGVSVGKNTASIRLRRNAIFDNGDAEIVLVDATSNGDIEPPSLTSVTVSGATTIIEGSFTGANSTAHELEFFDNDSCHISNSGGGKRWLGRISVTTNASGVGTFSHSVSPAVANPRQVTATLTDTMALNTSAFSRCVSDPLPTTTRISLSSGTVAVDGRVTATVSVETNVAGWDIPNGTVTVADESASTCEVTLDAAGEGDCELTLGVIGTRSIKATYVGTVLYATSNASTGLTVTPPSPRFITISAGSPQAAVVTEPFEDALVARVVDESNTPVPNVLVTFAAPLTGPSASLSSTSATTDADGLVTINATANERSGSYSVVATGVGAALPVPFELLNLPGLAVSLTADLGATPQSQQIGARYAKALAVTVRDAFDNPVAGVEVFFAAPATGASVALSAAKDVTHEDGVASVTATANSTEGAFVVTATVGGIAATFDLTNLERAPATIAVVSGSPQKAALTTAFAKPLVVVVKDASGAVVPDVEVTFAVPATGASVTAESLMATTDANGAAEISVTANDIAGEYVVAASAEGAESPATFHLSNTEDTHRLLTTGGGLSCASGSGTGMMSLMILGLFMMLRRRRAALTAALVLVAMPLVSSAQGFDLNRYRTGALASDGLTLERPTALEDGSFGASLTFSYARNPLAESVISGDGTTLQTYAVVRNQLNGALSLSYGLFDRVTVHGTLPFSLMQSGDAPSTSSFLTSAGSTAVGDVRLGARVRILGGLEGEDPSQGSLGFDAAILLPTGSTASYMSDGNVRGELKVLGEMLPTDFLYAGANVGVMLRSGVAFGPTQLGSSLVVGAAAGYRTEQDQMRLGIEANSDIAFTATEGAARAAAEAYGVASFRFLQGFHATVGVGPGLTNAIGTPAWRGLVRIGWAPNVERNKPAPVAEPVPVPVVEPVPEPEPVVEPEPEPQPEPEPEPIPEEVVVVVKAFEVPQSLYFVFAEATLLPESDAYLSEVAQLLLDNPSVRVSIEGHTDDQGTDTFNQDLSERRAGAVREALVAKGVGASRLTTKGYGKSRPVTDNTSEAGRERNRRVEFIVVQ